MSHSDHTVANVKGLLLEFNIPTVAAISGVPHGTVKKWKFGMYRKNVKARQEIFEELANLVQGADPTWKIIK